MRMTLSLLACAGLALAGAARADDAGLPFARLASFQGAAPSQLLADPQIKQSLAETLTPAQIMRLTAGPAFAVVDRTDGHLVFSGYVPGHGFDEGAVVFVSLRDAKVQVCLSEHGHDTWLAPGTAPRPLTQSACINDTTSLLPKYGI